MLSISPKRGLTLIELIIVIAIIGILVGISLIGLSSSRKDLLLKTSAEQILGKLEEARTNAVAGKYGLGSGVSFSSTSYTLFLGNTFAASSSNETVDLPDSLSLSVTPNLNEIVFQRLTGRPQSVATVTVSMTSASTSKKDIIIGIEGDMMIK